MKRVTVPSLLLTVIVFGWGVSAALKPVQVYGAPDFYEIGRRTDAEGHDRIYIRTTVRKLLNCDLESGSGPAWVDFYDADAGVPPPSAFYRPNGEQAGKTRAVGGESFVIDGYSAIVPTKMSEVGGTFIVRVPCQLWIAAADGSKAWGRKVVASWGPAPVPMPGSILSDHIRLYDDAN